MSMKALLAIGVFSLVAPLASAQVSVIGGGLARDCYKAAKEQRVSSREGEQICTKAIESEVMRTENRAATYTNRGVMRMRSGKYDAAINDYSVAKKLKPELGEIYLNEGAAHIFRKDFNTALTVLDEAIRLDSRELHAAYYNRAIAKEQTGDVQGAYYDFKKAQELAPEFELATRQLSRFTVKTN